MRSVVTASQSQEIDRAWIEGMGVPGVALMEVASRGVAEVIRSHFAEQAARGVVVVCGGGNNGGDGYGCARWLAGWGFPVRIWSLASASHGDADVLRQASLKVGIPRVSSVDGAGLVVDAVFGTGLSRPVEGAHAEVVQAMLHAGAPVVSVDLPSGLCADTGQVLGVAVRAAATVTFAHLKPGLLTEPGASLAGAVHVVDIGLPPLAEDAAGEVPDPSDLAARWPRRAVNAHKTRSGHLLVVAGSRNLAGAAVLACRGALAAGAGLVTLVAPGGAVDRLASLPPEVMVYTVGAGQVLDAPPRAVLDRRTAVVAGPGLGNGTADLSGPLADWLRQVWSDAALPVLFDADALPCAQGPGAGPRVVTPHPGEAGRLLGRSIQDVEADRFGAVSDLASHGRVALLKGRHTLVAHTGQPTSVNTSGNPVLATGGSGDVLAGVIGALLARGVSARDAARLGAWVHGRAADLLAARRGFGWTAGDVADAVPCAIAELCDP